MIQLAQVEKTLIENIFCYAQVNFSFYLKYLNINNRTFNSQFILKGLFWFDCWPKRQSYLLAVLALTKLSYDCVKECRTWWVSGKDQIFWGQHRTELRVQTRFHASYKEHSTPPRGGTGCNWSVAFMRCGHSDRGVTGSLFYFEKRLSGTPF